MSTNAMPTRAIYLSGYGGLSIRFDVTFDDQPVEVGEASRPGVDIVTPESVAHADVALSAADCAAIATFLDNVSIADVPARDIPALCLPCGLVLDPTGSDELRVDLTVDLPNSERDGHDDLVGVNFKTSRLTLANTAARFRGDITAADDELIDPDRAGSAMGHGTGEVGLFSGFDTDATSLIWALATPPPGSRHTGISPANRNFEDPGGDLAILAGWVFNTNCDPQVEMDVLRTHAGQRVVGEITGTLPDGRGFGLLLVQADWLTQMTFDALAGPDLSLGQVLADDLAPAQALVPYAKPAGYEMIDLDTIADHLQNQYRMDLPAGLGLFDALQGVLGETCRVGLDRILHARASECAFPNRIHTCQGDVLNDVLVAWDTNTGGLATQGTLPVRLPGMPDPLQAYHLVQTTATLTQEWLQAQQWSLPTDPAWHIAHFTRLGRGDPAQGMRMAMADPLYRPIPAPLLVELQIAVFGAEQITEAPEPSRPKAPPRRRKPNPDTTTIVGLPDPAQPQPATRRPPSGGPTYVAAFAAKIGPRQGQPPEVADLFNLAQQADDADADAREGEAQADADGGDGADPSLAALEQALHLLRQLVANGKDYPNREGLTDLLETLENVLAPFDISVLEGLFEPSEDDD